MSFTGTFSCRVIRGLRSQAYPWVFGLSMCLVAFGVVEPIRPALTLGALGMGVVSMFPMWGHLQKLKGFYPPHRKEWFIYLPAVIALIPYTFLQWSFQELPVYISLWSAFVTGVVALIAYISILVGCKNIESDRRGREGKPNVLQKVYVFVPLLVLFILFTVSFTYSLNVVENLREYDVFHGEVKRKGERAAGANVTFYWSDHPNKRSVKTDRRGKYHLIVPKTRFAKLNGMDVKWSSNGGSPSATRSYNSDELVRGWMRVEL